MKRVFCVFIILSYFYSFLGCMSSKQSTYSASELTTDNNHDMDVVTKSSLKFRFKSNTYQAIGDTLIGQGCAIIDDEEQKVEKVNIALNDIAYGVYNEEKLSTWSYVGMGVIGASMVVIAIIYDSNDTKKTSHIY